MKQATQLRKAFKKIDINSDGIISSDELALFLKKQKNANSDEPLNRLAKSELKTIKLEDFIKLYVPESYLEITEIANKQNVEETLLMMKK